MGIEVFTCRHNVMDIESLSGFMNIKGGVNQSCKDVCFVRMIGVHPQYEEEIQILDKVLTEQQWLGRCVYSRIGNLSKLREIDDINDYIQMYEIWEKSGRKEAHTRKSRENTILGMMIGSMCRVLCQKLKEIKPDTNTSMEKNFTIKMMYWLDNMEDKILKQWSQRMSYKVVFTGEVTSHEYLFFYGLTLLGMDVLLLLPKQDIAPNLDRISVSKKVVLGPVGHYDIPPYDASKWDQSVNLKIKNTRKERTTLEVRTTSTIDRQENIQPKVEVERTPNKIVIQIPERDRKKENTSQGSQGSQQTKSIEPMTFEQLAQLASSVVMIAIHDNKGVVMGTGSGIMIGKAGYILTNNHVACGGHYYSVKIENDNEIYTTNEIIKYHPILDLAVIRIQRTLKPLPIYGGSQKLVRGQKVVAIGSPLGFFNSVSDGIISGFREIDSVNMIQFTAPISHGSSGGAVLNMYGQVIGISTSGMDNGQNINLAVGYECMTEFAKSFIDKVEG